MPSPSSAQPPFRTTGVVTGAYFTDRAAEVARIARTLHYAGGKLTVFGRRRMGKTSALVRAVHSAARRGTKAAYCDLSTASTVTDVANAVLAAATPAIHRRWKDIAVDLARRIQVEASVSIEPGTGLAIPKLSVSLRSAEPETQWDALTRVLHALDRWGADHDTHVALALDEFQRLARFGGSDALWRLRGIIQHHAHSAYVLAGSDRTMVEQAIGPDGALFKLTEPLEFGPMDARHLARWIDSRLSSHGVSADGVGEACVTLAGPRTLDVMLVAEACWEGCRGAGRAVAEDAARAVDEVAGRERAMFERLWNELTALQQNVLRAVAAGADQITSAANMARWGLGNSSQTTQTLSALEARELVVRNEERWSMDSPFFGQWVRTRAGI